MDANENMEANDNMNNLDSMIGTKENPLKLKNQHQNTELAKKFAAQGKHYIHRPLLQACTKNNNGEGGFAFDKAHEENFDNYVANILSNPNLTPTETKIAIALQNKLFACDGTVFICTSNKLDTESFGDDGIICIGKNDEYAFVEKMPLHQLLSKEYGIKVNTDVLNKTLGRLDSFHYINLTPVILENGYIKCKERAEKPRAYLKHIALNDMMESKSLVNAWIKINSQC